jgi:hypothetical protein
MSNPVKLRRMAFTDADGMMSWGWTVQDNYASTLCRRMVMGDRVLNYWAVGGDTLTVPCKSYKLRCRWFIPVGTPGMYSCHTSLMRVLPIHTFPQAMVCRTHKEPST